MQPHVHVCWYSTCTYITPKQCLVIIRWKLVISKNVIIKKLYHTHWLAASSLSIIALYAPLFNKFSISAFDSWGGYKKGSHKTDQVIVVWLTPLACCWVFIDWRTALSSPNLRLALKERDRERREKTREREREEISDKKTWGCIEHFCYLSNISLS